MGTVASAGSALLAILSIEDLPNCDCEVSGSHKFFAGWLIFAAGLALTFESLVTVYRLLGVNIVGAFGWGVSVQYVCISGVTIFHIYCIGSSIQWSVDSTSGSWRNT